MSRTVLADALIVGTGGVVLFVLGYHVAAVALVLLAVPLVRDSLRFVVAVGLMYLLRAVTIAYARRCGDPIREPGGVFDDNAPWRLWAHSQV